VRPRQQRRRPVVAAVAALALAGAVVPAGAQAADGPNLVANGSFDPGVADQWWGIEDDQVSDGELCVDVSEVPRFGNFVDLGLVADETYVVGFTAHGDPGSDALQMSVQSDGAAGDVTYDVQESFAVSPAAATYEWSFTASGDAQRLQFELSGAQPVGGLCVSSVYVTPVAEVLANPTFDGLDPWWTTPNLELAEADGRMCGTVPAGGEQWDVILGQGGVTIEEGRAYTVTMTASAGPEASARVLVPRPGTDWPPLYFADVALRADGQTFTETFEAEADADTEIQVQLGGNDEPFDLCLDVVSLTTGGTVEEFEHETGPRVRVNQLGYLPAGPKNATLVTDATDAVGWELLDDGGAVVASGESAPAGFDESAGLDVHTIDFSDVTAQGTGFRLAADGEESYPFDITASLYEQLRTDALGIYYTQRSGIEIEPIEVDGELEKTEYVRPAGHVSAFGGDDVNQGDLAVPCLPPTGAVDHDGNAQRGADAHYGADGWACPEGYTVDAAGGWYDAGDHGKYVVNSGITVYQLLSTYERSLHAGVVDDGALGDSTLVVPERDNGVPDVLDEVRWNLDWMLTMQVDDGVGMTIDGEEVDAGGLVHHKLHDIAWTGLNTLPHEDPMPRYVHRPSTAATLNLAAAAAQGARLYAEHDEAYADELLDAARRAWGAASAHPEILAPNTNDLDPNPGGGPYDDDELADEWYWAAAQLFLTTGEDEFADAVLASEHHVGGAEGDIWSPTGFDWGSTAAAGRLDLATVPNHLPGRGDVIDSVVEGADRYLAVQQDEPFGHPYGPDRYDWGSTHQVVNNAVVVATAYDLTGEEVYRDAALESIDYVLGRNAINNSYVTGYGTHFSQNMHSRWYASADRLPPFPDGKVAGGPNSGIEDPVAQANLQGCAPQACYIDDVDSWSTNETTINWNAALAWYASWAADMGDGAVGWEPPAPTCEVSYTRHGTWPGGGANTQVWVTNLGPGTIEGWELTWEMAGEESVTQAWSADVTQDGSTVTAASTSWNGRLADPVDRPGRGRAGTTFGFLSTGAHGSPPEEFFLDGVRCATG
jgi:endoglucanase